MTDDQLPPIHDRETLDELPPVNDTEPPSADTNVDAEIVVPSLDAVPRGWARFELHRAVTHTQRSIDRLAEDMRALVALADSYARVLDAGTEGP